MDGGAGEVPGGGIDDELVVAAGFDGDARGCDDAGGGDGAGAAGERFAFDAAFVGADGDFVGACALNEGDVGAFGAEFRVEADGAADFADGERGEVIDEGDGVGHAGFDEIE